MALTRFRVPKMLSRHSHTVTYPQRRASLPRFLPKDVLVVGAVVLTVRYPTL